MKKIEYRSPGLPHNFFTKQIHVHIDGAKDPGAVWPLLQTLQSSGNLSKLNFVNQFIAGPQRLLLPEVYSAHTPVLAGREEFEFFSTTSLYSRYDAVRVTKFLGESLRNFSGLIIEVEKPVMWLGLNGSRPKSGNHIVPGWKFVPESEYLLPIGANEIGLSPGASLPFEIHHRFDLPKKGKQVDLDELGRFCEKSGIAFGGWFVFEKTDSWAYRSNSFSRREGLEEQVQREQESLNYCFLEIQGLPQAETEIEQIVAIGKI